MPDNDTPAPLPAPEQTPAQTPSPASSVDLSVLKNFSFGPDWSATPSTDALVRKAGSRGDGRDGERTRDSGGRPGGRDGAVRRDRRPSARAPAASPAPGVDGRGPARGDAPPAGDRGGQRWVPGGRPERGGPGPRYGDRRDSPPPFRPTHEVLFYPDEAAFRALTKAIRASHRTYELFEVAHLILQKPERFVIVLKPLGGTAAEPARVHVAQPDHLPFETEEEAVAHVFQKHLDKFCVMEEVAVEAPKGNFVGVSKCGVTGELLGPPNYHLYPQILREHHNRRLPRLPYDKFVARLELVKEPEQIAAWLEKMKKATRYKLKEPIEGAPEFFETVEAARAFLLGKKKDAIVRSLDIARYPGRLLEQFAPGNIRRSVEALLEQQRNFPLDTANNLRGRLRRMKFNLYKKGAKGVSYVCAVKRRFRDPQTVLADHVQKLITFLEAHPLTPLARLPYAFLGLPPPPETPPPPAPAAITAPVAVAAPAIPTAETPAMTENSSEAPAAETTETPVEAATDAPPAVAASTEPAVAAAPAEETPAAPAARAPTAASPPPFSHLAPEQQLQLRELLMNLRWLVAEGYVIEYSDGRLFAPPPAPAQKAKTGQDGAPSDESDADQEDTEIPDTEETPESAVPDATEEPVADQAAPTPAVETTPASVETPPPAAAESRPVADA